MEDYVAQPKTKLKVQLKKIGVAIQKKKTHAISLKLNHARWMA